LQLSYYPLVACEYGEDGEVVLVSREEAETRLNQLCDTMEVHAAHWPALPLCSLSIDASVYCTDSDRDPYGYRLASRTWQQRVDAAPFAPVDSPILHSLAQLTSLTYLGLRCDLPLGFASVVLQLTGLQELRLANAFELEWSVAGGKWNEEWRGECVGAMQSLMHAVGKLPQLRRLAMQWLCELMYPAAAKELSRARQLQHVELWEYCPVAAVEIEAIVRSGEARGCKVYRMPLAAVQLTQQLEV
jgi:hypothetical protein